MIKLGLEILSPLTADDHDILTAVAIMLVAIANRPLAEERFPEAFGPEDEVATPTTVDPLGSCGAVQVLADERRVCVGPSGHHGPHTFRPA